jgi:hypothetical protein
VLKRAGEMVRTLVAVGAGRPKRDERAPLDEQLTALPPSQPPAD